VTGAPAAAGVAASAGSRVLRALAVFRVGMNEHSNVEPDAGVNVSRLPLFLARSEMADDWPLSDSG